MARQRWPLTLGGGVPGGTSLRRLFQQTTPGFSSLQKFFSTWLNLDITTLAVALTVFGAISNGTQQLKYIALEMYSWVARFFTASVSIPGSDRLNREVLNWIGARVLLQQQTRILTATSEPVQNDAWDFRRAGIKRTDHHSGKRPPIQYLPTFGITWFFYDRNIFLVRRITDGRGFGRNAYVSGEFADQYVVPPAGHEPLVVMCLGRSVKPVKRFLNMCRDFADMQRESFTTVRASRNNYHREGWDTTMLRPIRPLETVNMQKTAKEELVSDMENYLKPTTRRFYTSRGIPYRRGYLLHGPPGTGKTSLSLALAGRFSLELYIIHVPSLAADIELERLFTSLPPQCIVLLEDIDAVGMKRKPDREDDDMDEKEIKEMRKLMAHAHIRHGRVTLSGLLNVLDGVISQEGRIVLMTSNIADKLDEALVRPGRIDKMIFMGNIDGDAAEEMFLRMYTPDQNETPIVVEPRTDLSSEELKRFAFEFRSRIPDDTFTPAQIQGHLLNYCNHPEAAVANLEDWAEMEKRRMEEAEEKEEEAQKRRATRRRERNQQVVAGTGPGGMQGPMNPSIPPSDHVNSALNWRASTRNAQSQATPEKCNGSEKGGRSSDTLVEDSKPVDGNANNSDVINTTEEGTVTLRKTPQAAI